MKGVFVGQEKSIFDRSTEGSKELNTIKKTKFKRKLLLQMKGETKIQIWDY